MNHSLLLRTSILIAALLLAFGLATPAHAVPANAVVLLDDAYATLAQAKHDYKGHRVRAMKQIELALGEAGGKVSGHGHAHEPQGTSDAQLKAAEALLREASGSMSKKGLKHVDAAMEQINIALRIR